MEKNEFNQLSDRDRKEWTAKLLHAINVFPHAFMIANSIIELAEKQGYYEQVKFGNNGN